MLSSRSRDFVLLECVFVFFICSLLHFWLGMRDFLRHPLVADAWLLWPGVHHLLCPVVVICCTTSGAEGDVLRTYCPLYLPPGPIS